MESSTPPAGYEFDATENETIARAARWIGFWSWIAILGGAFVAVVSFLDDQAGVGDVVGGLVVAAVYLAIGIYYRGATRAMRSVVETRGDDIAHLLTAVERLGSAHKVMGVLVIVMFAFVALAVLLAGGAMLAGAGG